MTDISNFKSKEQSAVVLGVSVQTINRLIEKGELTPIKIGKFVRLNPEDLESYLQRQINKQLQSA